MWMMSELNEIEQFRGLVDRLELDQRERGADIMRLQAEVDRLNEHGADEFISAHHNPIVANLNAEVERLKALHTNALELLVEANFEIGRLKTKINKEQS